MEVQVSHNRSCIHAVGKKQRENFEALTRTKTQSRYRHKQEVVPVPERHRHQGASFPAWQSFGDGRIISNQGRVRTKDCRPIWRSNDTALGAEFLTSNSFLSRLRAAFSYHTKPPQTRGFLFGEQIFFGEQSGEQPARSPAISGTEISKLEISVSPTPEPADTPLR